MRARLQFGSPISEQIVERIGGIGRDPEGLRGLTGVEFDDLFLKRLRFRHANAPPPERVPHDVVWRQHSGIHQGQGGLSASPEMKRHLRPERPTAQQQRPRRRPVIGDEDRLCGALRAAALVRSEWVTPRPATIQLTAPGRMIWFEPRLSRCWNSPRKR